MTDILAGSILPNSTSPDTTRRLLGPDELAEVARSLGTVLGAMDVGATSDPGVRDWARVVATATFDAWLIRWPTGGAVEPHDHGGAAGAIVVIMGELVELSFPDDSEGLRRVLPAGALHHVDPDSVHDVLNEGQATAMSLHVYSPPLETMGFYEDGELRRVELVGFEEPIWPVEGMWSS